MKIYIIEDDFTVVHVLQNIIEDFDLGVNCGYSLDGENIINRVANSAPDIILVDLLLPKRDGIHLVEDLKQSGCTAKFIMLSQVSAKNMIAEAYKAGVDFFINKPINAIEVNSVVKKIIQQISYESTLNHLKGVLYCDIPKAESYVKDTNSQKLNFILNEIGISSEKGKIEILEICNFLMREKKQISEINVNDIFVSLNFDPKTSSQRVRRAITKAMSSIAHMGIDDYMNETFVTYSNRLFSFEEIKLEMDYINGKRTSGGKINIKKFIDGLIINLEHQ